MAVPSKYQAKEVLNKVLNSGEDALNVDLSAGASAILVDDAAFTPATSSVQMVGAEFNDSTPDSVDEGDAGAVRMSGRREIYTQIRDSAGGELGAGVLTANTDADPDLDGLNLLGTHALLSARTNATTTVGLTAVSDTHNALHVAITDGTNALVMQAASGETEDERVNALTSVSTVYGFDQEGSTGSQLRAVQVAADNAGLTTAPNVLVSGGIYKAALDTYADNDASPLHFDAKGQLLISGDATLGTTTYSETATKGITVGVVRNDTLAALAGTDNEIAPLQVNKTGALYTIEETGQLGSIFENATTVYDTKQIVAIQFLEDTKFTTLTTDSTIFPGTHADDNGIQIDNNDVFPQGMTIFGKWTAFTLASGSVIAYQGAW